MALAPWAEVTPGRRAHIERVVTLLEQWADELRLPPGERARWVRAGYLHDALRDAALGGPLAHGPAAAARAERDGENDPGVLDAVRYHSTGYAAWDDVGRMLYLADYLEPGRDLDPAERTELVTRVPRQRDAVLVDVAGRRLTWLVESRWPVPAETADFWNALVSR